MFCNISRALLTEISKAKNILVLQSYRSCKLSWQSVAITKLVLRLLSSPVPSRLVAKKCLATAYTADQHSLGSKGIFHRSYRLKIKNLNYNIHYFSRVITEICRWNPNRSPEEWWLTLHTRVGDGNMQGEKTANFVYFACKMPLGRWTRELVNVTEFDSRISGYFYSS